MIEKETERIQKLMREIHFPSNPNFSMIFSRKIHSTLSYALLMSSFNAMNPDFPLILDLRRCSVSKATRMLFEMRWFDMYALCVSKTSFGKSFLNRLAMVFAIIL